MEAVLYWTCAVKLVTVLKRSLSCCSYLNVNTPLLIKSSFNIRIMWLGEYLIQDSTLKIKITIRIKQYCLGPSLQWSSVLSGVHSESFKSVALNLTSVEVFTPKQRTSVSLPPVCMYSIWQWSSPWLRWQSARPCSAPDTTSPNSSVPNSPPSSPTPNPTTLRPAFVKTRSFCFGQSLKSTQC